MIPKNGDRFSDKIMVEEEDRASIPTLPGWIRRQQEFAIGPFA
jgi:hypothetical protein